MTSEKAKVNKRQSRRRWWKAGLATVNGGSRREEKPAPERQVQHGAASWRHADFRKYREHQANGGGRWIRVLRQENRTHDGREEPGPARAAAPLGPPPRLQHHPLRGKRKCIWRQSPAAGPRGSAFNV